MAGSRASVEFDVPIRTRDGVTLPADVYRPDGAGPFPVLLTRTPYDKSGRTGTRFSALDALTAVQRGYAVVIQDVRGRHAAEGEFITFAREAEDGFDTVEWVGRQPWCDGNVGMYGRSYVGATQWLAATAGPPHLKAIAPGVTASDYHEGWTYQGGAFSLGFNLSWALQALTARNFGNLQRKHGLNGEHFEQLLDAVDATHHSFHRLPLHDQPWLDRDHAPYYYEWLAHPEEDEYWSRWKIEASYDSIRVPSLNIGGWFDIFLLGTLRNFTGMRQFGATEAARRESRLVIGPWSHGSIGSNQTGAVDFGVRASSIHMDLEDLSYRWFDEQMRGKQGAKSAPPVTIFVMGENQWRHEDSWPLARAVSTRFYLHSDGRANTRNGDGRLSTQVPNGERADHYLYDPMNPVPTQGGPLCCNPTVLPAGPMDHSSKEDRSDVLVYSTPPLEQDVEVTGPIRLVLWASSSAVDTDFTGMLLDVGPCGCARNLTEGIIRARYRDGYGVPKLLTPGVPERLEIDLVATSNLFKKGHQIRLEVSSSNFPRFDRNLNTGKGFDSDEVAVATNAVYHNAAHASFVELPVVPR